MSQVNILLDLGVLIVLTVIWFTDNKSKVEMQDKYLFRTMMVSVSTILSADAVAYLVADHTFAFAWYISLFTISVYFIAQAVFCWQWFLLALARRTKKSSNRNHFLFYIYAIPIAAEFVIIAFVNPFTGIVFTIDELANYHRGPFYYWNLLVFYVYAFTAFVMVIVTVVRDKNKASRKKNEMLIFVSVAPIMASFIQTAVSGFSILWPIAGLSVYLMYEIEAQHYLEFKATKQAELEAELANNKISIMMSQIQPHFLYNTLTTIRALVGKDPEEAQNVITAFAAYLRTNMDSMNLTTPVPFTKELEHTQTYTQIEQLRFSDLEVEYDINDRNFMLPALTVQPMVENAIKHGIRQRKEPGGKVIVKTFRDGSRHVVQIIDNGAGFSDSTPKDTTRSHIGLSNTKKRIEEMMHGQFIIESTVGEGTTVSFIIPETEKEDRS